MGADSIFADWISLCCGALSSLMTKFFRGSCTLRTLILHGWAPDLLQLTDNPTCMAYWGCNYSPNDVISKYFRPALSHVIALLGKRKSFQRWEVVAVLCVFYNADGPILFSVCRSVEHGTWRVFVTCPAEVYKILRMFMSFFLLKIHGQLILSEGQQWAKDTLTHPN